MEILTPFTGEMLVLAMLVFLNARIFFTRHTRHDALAVLAPLSVLVMFFQMMAWGIRLMEIAILALALIATILNYRSIVRFSQHLYVDSYSLKFFISSLLLLLAVVFVLVMDILMCPVRLQTYRYNVKVQHEYYSCPLASNALNWNQSELKKAAEINDKRNLTLYTFSNKEIETQKDTVILFVPDVQAETLNYEPYLVLLARAGYTVVAADLYDDDFRNIKGTKFLRRFLILFEQIKAGGVNKAAGDQDKNAFTKARATEFSKIYENSYNALASIAKTEYPEKSIFIVSDSSAVLETEKIDAIFANHFTAPDARAFPRFLDLASIKDYSTPGCGFVAQTNPIFAKLFLGVERDRKSFVPSYCVLQTRQRIGD